MATLAEIRRSTGSLIADPIAAILARTGIGPNAVTSLSLLLSIAAAYLIASGHFRSGGFLILVSGLCDLLDGALARATRKTTAFGAILDSTVDRVSEALVFCALLVWYWPAQAAWQSSVILATMIGSFLVSYIRARAEGLGLECRVGLFTRAERVIVLAVGLMANQVVVALWLLVICVYVTVVQRLLHLRRQGTP